MCFFLTFVLPNKDSRSNKNYQNLSSTMKSVCTRQEPTQISRKRYPFQLVLRQGEYSRNRIVINNSDYREANDKRTLSLIRKIRWLISFIIYIAHIGHQYFSVWIDPGPWLVKSLGGFICNIRRINWSFCNWLPTPPLSYSFALNE